MVHEIDTWESENYMKPFLFIDVDGVLNPDSPWAPEGFDTYEILDFTVHLNKEHGAELNRLSYLYDLVWASTWQSYANTHIAPKIGLPELPYVKFSVRYPGMRRRGKPMVKTFEVIEYANGRPFAWVDDDFNVEDLVAIDNLQDKGCFCMPVKTDSWQGITAKDFDWLEKWGSERGE